MLVLQKWETEAWQGRYEAPSAFAAAHPKCCVVSRYPEKKDWSGGIEEVDPDARIARGLRRYFASEFLVTIRVETESGDATYFVTGCGDFLLKRSFSRKNA